MNTTTLEIIETINELRAVTPAEKFAQALRMSIKALEMGSLDTETKALAISEYKKVLEEVAPVPIKSEKELRIEAELSAYEQELQKLSHRQLIIESKFRFSCPKERLIAALLREKKEALSK